MKENLLYTCSMLAFDMEAAGIANNNQKVRAKYRKPNFSETHNCRVHMLIADSNKTNRLARSTDNIIFRFISIV